MVPPVSTDELGSEREERIVAAATALFGRYGFRRTSMDLIAAEAGVAKATLYAYFDSKEALFGAVTAHVCEELLRRADEAAAGTGTLRERVRGVLEAKYTRLYELVHSSPHAAEILDSTSKLGAVVEDTDKRYRQIVERVLRRAQHDGHIDLAGTSAARVADVLLWSALGISSSAPDVATHDKRLGEAVDTILRGVSA